MSNLLPYDLHEDWIDVEEAAHLAGVRKAVVRNWVYRGYRARDGRWQHLPAEKRLGKLRMHGIDVLRAEAATRHRARR